MYIGREGTRITLLRCFARGTHLHRRIRPLGMQSLSCPKRKEGKSLKNSEWDLIFRSGPFSRTKTSTRWMRGCEDSKMVGYYCHHRAIPLKRSQMRAITCASAPSRVSAALFADG